LRVLTALGIVIAVLVFFLVYVFVGNPGLHIAAWVVVLAVATFFAAGGGTEGLTKQLAGNLAGCFWAAVSLAIWNAIAPGNILALSIILAIAGFIMCVEASAAPLAFIPAAFIGAGLWIGANGAGPFTSGMWMTVVAVVIGGILGIISQYAADRLGGVSPARVEEAAVTGQ